MRKTKMFYGNQYIGKFTCDGRVTLKSKIMAFTKKLVRKCIFWFIIGLAAFGLAKLYQTMYPKTVYQDVTVDISDKMFEQKIDSLEKSVVEQVRKCESGGHKESDGLIVFDSNRVASIGTMQFQVSTVQLYYKSLYNKIITGKEAIAIALDDKLAGELAQDILFNAKDGYKNWYNCANKMSLDSQITAIKKIQ